MLPALEVANANVAVARLDHCLPGCQDYLFSGAGSVEKPVRLETGLPRSGGMSPMVAVRAIALPVKSHFIFEFIVKAPLIRHGASDPDSIIEFWSANMSKVSKHCQEVEKTFFPAS